MEQYIPKSALVAEIERRKDESWLGHYTKEKGIVFDITDDILSFIDTLEVKEVDLEKESLTWEDMRELYIIFAEVDTEIELCQTDIKAETIGYYEEVLKRFKNLKK